MPTQIGSRQLRSNSAHCAGKLAKRFWPRVGKADVDVEVDADMVEEKQEEEEEEEAEEEEKEDEENSSDKIKQSSPGRCGKNIPRPH